MQALLMGGDGGFYGSAYPDVDHSSGFGSAFVAVVVVLVVGGMVYAVTSAVRNARVMRRGGLDPMTARSQLAVDLHRGATAPAADATRTLEERLAELDDLAARGVITDDERAQARLRLLSGPPS